MVLVYPMWHRVSFSLIAERHVEQLRKYFKLYTIDERVLNILSPATNPLLIIHPYFYPMSRYAKHIERLLARVRGIIGIDVADSDRISNVAVSMTHYAECMIVPSKWSKEAYVRSGVKVPVHILPHGLDQSWYTDPPRVQFFMNLLDLKRKHGLKYLLYFCWHSEYRKGLDLVLETYKILRRERKDIVLIAKFMSHDGYPHMVIRSLGGIIISGWLSEEQKRELYDIADIYLLFSRGGAFEHNGLEALARNNIVLAAEKGAWTEYLPQFSLLPCRPTRWVLKDNPIHCGGGVEVIVEKAVDKICEIADNLDDYKARVKEYVNAYVKDRFNWVRIGRELADIVRRYLK